MRREYMLSATDFISIESISNLRFWSVIILVELVVFFVTALSGYAIVFGAIPMYLIMAWYTNRRKGKIRNMSLRNIASVRQFGYDVKIIPWNSFTWVQLKGKSLELRSNDASFKLEVKGMKDSVQHFLEGLGTPSVSKKEMVWTRLMPVVSPVQEVPQTVPIQPPAPSHRTRNTVLVMVAIVIVGFLVISVLSYLYLSNTGVYVTTENFSYNCPNCTQTFWTYSASMNASAGKGATVTGSVPYTWPSSQTCPVTFTDFRATTPGFTFSVSPLPLMISPGQTVNATTSIVMPSQSYSGPLNVSVTLSLNC